jgi:hypothetical protein
MAAGFISEWWPASNRNRGRLHVGIPGRNKSVSAPLDPDVAPPSFQLPDNATDCHMHLFGDLSRFPCVSDRDYTPAEAGIAAARKLYGVLGIRRFVAIQPSVYGADNRCQFEFGTALGLPFRAVVVLPSRRWSVVSHWIGWRSSCECLARCLCALAGFRPAF